MTSRRALERRQVRLEDIRDILNAMRSLAYMEVQRSARQAETLRDVRRNIERAAADLVRHYPQAFPHSEPRTRAELIIGSERGFCGDFNADLIRSARDHAPPARWIVVGERLRATLTERTAVLENIDGASVAGDLPAVLDRVVTTLVGLNESQGPLGVRVHYHDEVGRTVMRDVLPAFTDGSRAPATWAGPTLQGRDTRGDAVAPMLSMPLAELAVRLGEQFMEAALTETLYRSLWSENLQRVTHLGGAVRHLERKSGDLRRRAKALRQEEIVEEIEILTLNTGSVPG
jgi:F-type H+-transporting ATPase subunit gamma